jgi:hypothetical protein
LNQKSEQHGITDRPEMTLFERAPRLTIHLTCCVAACTASAIAAGPIILPVTGASSGNTNNPVVSTNLSPSPIVSARQVTVDSGLRLIGDHTNLFLANRALLYKQLRPLPKATTPWATTGNTSTSAVPWWVYTTTVVSNATNSVFPSAVYDAPRGRIIASYIDSSTHECTNGTAHLVDSYDGGLSWVNDRELDLFPGHGLALTLSALPDGRIMGVGFLRDVINHGAAAGTLFRRTNLNIMPIHILESLDGVTWTTNSMLQGTNYQAGVGGLLETDTGTWLVPLYSNVTGTNAEIARSTDRGRTWSYIELDDAANESCIVQRKNGELITVGRTQGAQPNIYSSADDGLTWTLVGPSGVNHTNADVGAVTWYSSYPACVLMGDRLVLLSREQPFGHSALWYSDAYPYTNGWKFQARRGRPSMYDWPVKLSESVVLWLSSFDNHPTIVSSGLTNAWVEAWVMANDAEGWSGSCALRPVSEPAVALLRKDLPAVGRVRTWPNLGTLGVSPTNEVATDGALTHYVAGAARALWCVGFTNVYFTASNHLPSFWQTNIGTIVWRLGRTNQSDSAYVVDTFHAVDEFHGFGLRHWGNSIRFAQGGGTDGSFAGEYNALGTADYTGAMHTYAATFTNNTVRTFVDGHLAHSHTVTNTGTKAFSTNANTTLHMSFGTFAVSSGGTPVLLSDILMFTNALSESEVLYWMSKIK